MKFFKSIKTKLCKHDYEIKNVLGYKVEDGFLYEIKIVKCRKCGKIKNHIYTMC